MARGGKRKTQLQPANMPLRCALQCKLHRVKMSSVGSPVPCSTSCWRGILDRIILHR